MSRAPARSPRPVRDHWLRAVLAVSAAGLASCVPGRLVRRVVVEGESMLPTLEPGDRLLVVRTRHPRVGDLVAVPDPRDPARLLVKRVARRSHGMLELQGDNAPSSTDSRVFGPLPPGAVWGRVVRRYAPAGRAGPVA